MQPATEYRMSITAHWGGGRCPTNAPALHIIASGSVTEMATNNIVKKNANFFPKPSDHYNEI